MMSFWERGTGNYEAISTVGNDLALAGRGFLYCVDPPRFVFTEEKKKRKREKNITGAAGRGAGMMSKLERRKSLFKKRKVYEVTGAP